MTRFFGLLVAAIVAGCGDGVPKPAAVDPISADEAVELARRFEAAVEPCDPDKVDALLDTEQLMRAAFAKSHLRARVKRGPLATADVRAVVVNRLCASFTPDIEVDLLRVREVNGQHRPLFRASAGAGVSYYEVIGGKSKQDGSVRVVDLYMYTAGDTLSGTMTTVLDRAIGPFNPGQAPEPMRMDAATQAGDYAEIRRLIARLPPGIRDSKTARLMDLQAARAVQAPDYVDTLDRYIRAFPDDPSLDLVAIDGYFVHKQVAPLLAAIDRLDRRVGGDPYLDAMRASALLLEPTPEHLADADRRAHAAAVALPDRRRLWWNLAEVQLARRDYVALVPTLDKLASRFGVTFDRVNMATDERWQGFLASPEFAPWWSRVTGH